MKVASLADFTFKLRKKEIKYGALVECQIVNVMTPEVHSLVVLLLRHSISVEEVQHK